MCRSYKKEGQKFHANSETGFIPPSHPITNQAQMLRRVKHDRFAHAEFEVTDSGFNNFACHHNRK